MSAHYPPDYDAFRGVDHEETRRRYEKQAEFVGPGPGRLLDIGAARGDFVSWMSDRAWNAIGIDPFSRKTNGTARVLNVSIDSPELDTERFDVITAWHVLEHAYSPMSMLSRILTLLNPGGRFFFSVPNFRSYRARLLKGEDVPRHLYFFSSPNLNLYALRTGFQVRQVSYDAAFASGSLGRGAFTRFAYRLFGGVSAYDYLVARHDPTRDLSKEHPFISQLARPLNWFERRWLSEERLQRHGTMGVVAMEFVRPHGR